jgi:hypothetical protein
VGASGPRLGRWDATASNSSQVLIFHHLLVVIHRAFFFLLHNHIINIKKYFSFSGEVKDSVIFPFIFCFTRELNHVPYEAV